ncbi:TIGR03085 family protein [Rhodococcus sp. 06-418-1B]|nr:TIGR03085 family protein [Rhodococcus sp. 06-418-1B]
MTAAQGSGHVRWIDVTLAQHERAELVLSLTAAGESAPTLCGDWTTRDLAAHLVVRERRLDAAPGILLPLFDSYTQKVQNEVARRSFSELVAEIAAGPPVWSPFKILDPLVNVGEMFVHHEDVRRAQSGWSPRLLSADLQNRLWRLATVVGRLAYRRSPVGVVLETLDGRSVTVKRGGGEQVVLVGRPSELLLHAFGRSEVHLDRTGNASSVEAVEGLDRSF